MKTYADIRGTLDTGDIVLFSGKGGISDCIKLFSGSKWSHIGIVVKHVELDFIMLWESTTLCNVADAEDGTQKQGVQIVALSDRLNSYDGDVSVRKFLGQRTPAMLAALKQFRDESKNKAYEQSKLELIHSLLDWAICEENNEDFSSFFCSELVAEALERMGIMNGKLPANEFIPRDFKNGNRFEHYLNPGMTYSPEIVLKEEK
jgi:hypothetical protein